MPKFATLSNRFLGGTIGNAAGYAAGGAVHRTLDPLLQDVVNETWSKHPTVPPDAYALAEGVAQGQVDPGRARDWAAEQGIGGAQFAALVNIATTGPGAGEAFRLWRRRLLDDDGFATAIRRAGVEERWIQQILHTKFDPLAPADLARSIHRGLVRDPGLMPVEQPTGVGKVPPYPVTGIDAIREAEASGVDREHLAALVGLQGNPMGAHEAANATFRGVIDRADFDRAIAEGNTRNEWGEAIFEQSRQIPTARDFLENALRGYSTLADAIEGAAKHGLSAEDATLIYQNQGRPMNIHQITMALARGAHFNPEPGEITDPYMASIVEGSLKPGYYEMENALRYNYPAFFQTLNALAKGWIDADTARQWLLYQAYEPGAVDAIVSNVADRGPAKPSSWVTRAQGYLFTAIHKKFEPGAVYEAKARAALTLIGISEAEQATILDLYREELKLEPPDPADTAGTSGGVST
jgi:hypothetical protein